MKHHQDLERMIPSGVRSAMDFYWNTKYWENFINREKGNLLINKAASLFKDMSHDYLRQWCRTNRNIKRNNEWKGEKERKREKKERKRMKEEERRK